MTLKLTLASDLDIITSRFLESFLPVDTAGVKTLDLGVQANLTLLTTNSTNGDVTFSDINYLIDTPAFWPAFFHIKRASLFNLAYSTPSSVFYNDSSLLQTIKALLSTWLKYDYGCGGNFGTNPGWWYCQVGCPDALSRLVLSPAINSTLTTEEYTSTLVQLSRAKPPASCPDANCVWLGSNALYRALFTRNETLAGLSIATIFSTMKTWTPPANGGMQADKTFTMHGKFHVSYHSFLLLLLIPNLLLIFPPSSSSFLLIFSSCILPSSSLQLSSSYSSGPLLYSGGYGMEYVQGIINTLLFTQGTQWAMDANDERIATFTNFLLDGSASMISFTESDSTGVSPYGSSFWDISAIGREISRPYGFDWYYQAGQCVLWTGAKINAFASLNGPRNNELILFSSLLNGSISMGATSPILNRNRNFYLLDYMVHRRPGWMISQKMGSSRIYRSECGNEENLQGANLGDGGSFLMQPFRRGLEYVDVFPAWNWSFIPGTNVALDQKNPGCSGVGGYGVSNFVGMASDGVYGVTAYNFTTPPQARSSGKGVSLFKSVSYFDTCFMTLMANITQLSPSSPMVPSVTVIEQRRMPSSVPVGVSDVFTNENPSAPFPPGDWTLSSVVWWLWEGNVGYLFPDPAPSPDRGCMATGNGDFIYLHVSIGEASGNWSSIGAETGNVSVNMFTFWIEHPQQGANSCYITVPNISLADFAAHAMDWVENTTVVNNSPHSQSVLSANGQGVATNPPGVLAAAVYDIDGVFLSTNTVGWSANVSLPGAFVITINDELKTTSFAASNPTQKEWLNNASSVSMTLDRPGDSCNTITIDGASANGTTTVNIC
jgi:hypothetical protein